MKAEQQKIGEFPISTGALFFGWYQQYLSNLSGFLGGASTRVIFFCQNGNPLQIGVKKNIFETTT